MSVTRYVWNNSAVEKIEISKAFSGNDEAMVFAAPDAPAGSLAGLPEALARRGIPVYFDFVNGQNVMKVTNFGSEANLTSVLRAVGATSGTPVKQHIEDKEHKASALQTIRENGTNIAGALGLGGHIALMASGYIAHERERISAGAKYGTSAATLAIFGSGSDKMFPRLCAGLHEHLQNEGVHFGHDGIITPVTAYEHRNVLEKGYDTFKSHSILAANLIGVGGNIDMIKSGISVASRDGFWKGVGRGAHGGVNVFGAAAASFIPEKDAEQIAREDEQRAREGNKHSGNFLSNAFHRVTDWISRYPLGFQGGIMLTDNMAAFGDTISIKKRYEQRQITDSVELKEAPKSPHTEPANPHKVGTKEFEDFTRSAEYKKWQKDEKAFKKSKEYKAWEKENNKALHTTVGHTQKLEMNAGRISGILDSKLAELGDKLHLPDLKNLLEVPSAEKCLEHVRTLDHVIEKFGGHNKELETLLKDRRVLLQELEEVKKYPRGWMLALAKSSLWTLSSAFQAIASKNHQINPEQKYGELGAYVATMALEVSPEQRDSMVHKSAEFLAAQDDIYIKATDLEKTIHVKLDAMMSSPWLNIGGRSMEIANRAGMEAAHNDYEPAMVANLPLPNTAHNDYDVAMPMAVNGSPMIMEQAIQPNAHIASVQENGRLRGGAAAGKTPMAGDYDPNQSRLQ